MRKNRIKTDDVVIALENAVHKSIHRGCGLKVANRIGQILIFHQDILSDTYAYLNEARVRKASPIEEFIYNQQSEKTGKKIIEAKHFNKH